MWGTGFLPLVEMTKELSDWQASWRNDKGVVEMMGESVGSCCFPRHAEELRLACTGDRVDDASGTGSDRRLRGVDSGL